MSNIYPFIRRLNQTLLWRILLLTGSIMMLHACSTPNLSASQTAERFWLAALAQDSASAKQYATVDMPEHIEFIDEQWKGGQVTFGDVQLKTLEAQVETSVRFPGENQANFSSFNTHLVKQDQRWLVNYQETKQSLQQAQKQFSLNKVINGLQQLSTDFSKHVDEAIKDLDKTVPEIKADIESLGIEAAKELENAINKLTPEIKQKLESLSEALEKALKDDIKPNDNGPENNQEKLDTTKGRLI